MPFKEGVALSLGWLAPAAIRSTGFDVGWVPGPLTRSERRFLPPNAIRPLPEALSSPRHPSRIAAQGIFASRDPVPKRLGISPWLLVRLAPRQQRQRAPAEFR